MEKNMIELDFKSETFDENHVPLSFHLRVEVAPNAGEPLPEATAEGKSFDQLVISFVSKKPVSAEVKEYISNNLGTFELIENGDEKKFCFELKIKDIGIEEINDAFNAHFKKHVQGVVLDIDFRRSETFEQCYQRMNSFFRTPAILHAIEKSHLRMTLDKHSQLLAGFFDFLKAKVPQLKSKLVFSQIFSLVSSQIVYSDFQKFNHKIFEKLEYDQREIFKELLTPFDNPINEYIFGGDEPGELHIKGTVVNILAYKVDVKLPKFNEFIKQVSKL